MNRGDDGLLPHLGHTPPRPSKHPERSFYLFFDLFDDVLDARVHIEAHHFRLPVEGWENDLYIYFRRRCHFFVDIKSSKKWKLGGGASKNDNEESRRRRIHPRPLPVRNPRRAFTRARLPSHFSSHFYFLSNRFLTLRPRLVGGQKRPYGPRCASAFKLPYLLLRLF